VHVIGLGIAEILKGKDVQSSSRSQADKLHRENIDLALIDVDLAAETSEPFGKRAVASRGAFWGS
jgi:hypothetical protein